MSASHRPLRTKVSLELGTIALLTSIFLILFPHRNPMVDVALAGCALLGVGASAGYTRRVIWMAAAPQPLPDARRRCVKMVLLITAPVVLIFLVIGAVFACRQSGWPAVVDRVLHWKLLASFGGYLIWALMQQTLLQFYMLGRLLVLFPKDRPLGPLLLTGLGFALVHLPDVWTSLATAVAGVVWGWLYYRFRALLPLAVSHAALGTAFYYGIFGHDLAVEWKSAISGILR